MARIPMIINNVRLEFDPDVENEVDPRLVEGLFHCIPTPGNAPLLDLQVLWISSASEYHPKHNWPSRHSNSLVVKYPMFKAVDISRVNGIRMAEGYPSSPTVKAVVDSMQTVFETYVHRRENFGPLLKRKLGLPHNVGGHLDHIHFSVN